MRLMGGALRFRYFPRTFAVGATTHTDSWGSNMVTYDYDAASLDRFANSNPAFLSIFSAGNYGQYRSDYNTTVRLRGRAGPVF